MLGVLVVVALIAGCTSDDPVPPLVEVDQPAGDAVIRPAGRTLVPSDPPRGFIPQVVQRETDGHSAGTVRLYGEPGTMDHESDPLLLALWQQPESDGALPGAYGSPGTRVTGGEGAVRWITWPVANGYTDADSVGVLGRSVAEADVQRAADSLLIDPPMDVETVPRETSASLVPEGFVELAAGQVSIGELGFGAPPGSSSLVTWTDGRARMTVATYAYDDALALLLRVGVDDPAGTTIRGQAGAHGRALVPTNADADGDIWTWSEDGMVVVVLTREMDPSTVGEMIESFEVRSDWDALVTQASQPLARDPNPAVVRIAEGFPGGWWSWAVTWRKREAGPAEWGFEQGGTIRHVDGSQTSLGGGFYDPSAVLLNIAGDSAGVLFAGGVPAVIEQLELELADGTVLRPELQARDDGWPTRPWAVWAPLGSVLVDLRGFDATGDQRVVGAVEHLASIGDMGSGSYGTWFALD